MASIDVSPAPTATSSFGAGLSLTQALNPVIGSAWLAILQTTTTHSPRRKAPNSPILNAGAGHKPVAKLTNTLHTQPPAIGLTFQADPTLTAPDSPR